MSKTVKDHLEDCKQVSVVIDNANALLTKTKDELQRARDVLEALIDYQHPLLSVNSYSYQVGKLFADNKTDKGIPPVALIKAEIAAINNLLGDRA